MQGYTKLPAEIKEFRNVEIKNLKKTRFVELLGIQDS